MSEATNGNGTTAMAPAQMSPEAQKFELMQRQAKLFASSPLVPEHLRKDNGLANCYIALVLAEQMGENPLVVMQNIYFVHGKPGWSASYMIAKANASGVFKGVLRFKHTGQGPTRACTCYGTLKDTDEVVETTVSMEMAKAEGWTKNSKYQTMPDLMLQYRAATFLVRSYCPHVMLGYHTEDEIRDVDAALGVEDADRASPKAVVEALKARVAEAAPVEPVKAPEPVPDAVVVEKSADTPDALLTLIADYEAAGGVFPEWCEAQGMTEKSIKASRNKARSEWCSKLNAEIKDLRTAPAAGMSPGEPVGVKH